MANAVVMLAPFERARQEPHSFRAELDEPQEAALCQAAATIFDTLGVSQDEDVVGSWEYTSGANIRMPRAAVLLRRASDVAGEAIALGYDPTLPEDDLRTKATKLVEDYKAYTDENIHKKDTDPRYGERRAAKRLLIESAARELARRNGLDDTLTATSMRQIQGVTGMPLVARDDHFLFVGVIPPRVNVLPRTPHRPATGVSSDWYYAPELAGPQTPHSGGYVPGRIGHFVLDPRYTGGQLPR